MAKKKEEVNPAAVCLEEIKKVLAAHNCTLAVTYEKHVVMGREMISALPTVRSLSKTTIKSK